ncbi:uncharacterized protein LOC118201504 isoform X2 [Stegodyphus dumicola]|uniref:uncharacterized protein LOC118201504 isoform X2 n=1 Tax=Stegodyphus dumicola TaxID=202533 RepID=UPI0015A90338|nr:uncharacterized protein LOC118201504 isoform X2 [Stegodyphus dumicola]
MTYMAGSGEVFSHSQLKKALVDAKTVIVIKDPKLGNKTVSWLQFGRRLQDMCVFTAIGSVICSSALHESISRFGKPLAVGCVLMNIGYCYFWNSHPLQNYKVAQGPSVISAIRNTNTNSTILVRKVEPSSTKLPALLAIGALITAFWKDLISFDFKESFRNSVFRDEQ